MGLAFGLLKQALPRSLAVFRTLKKRLAMLVGEEILIFPNLWDAGLRQSAVFAEESPVNSRLRIGCDHRSSPSKMCIAAVAPLCVKLRKFFKMARA